MNPKFRNSRPLASMVKILAVSILLVSCAGTTGKSESEDKDKKKDQEESKAPKLVGRVASVPSDRQFVLIQSYGKWTVTTGAVLATVGPGGRSANLRVTGEKLGQFAAADIQSGELKVGDGVYTTITPPAPDEEQTVDAENPETLTPQNLPEADSGPTFGP